MNRHERRKAEKLAEKRLIQQKDLDWLQAMLDKRKVSEDTVWASSYFIIWMNMVKREVALLYVAPFEVGPNAADDATYTLRLYRRLGWTVREADAMGGNMVFGAPGAGEIHYQYEGLERYTWEVCQHIHRRAFATLGHSKPSYDDTSPKTLQMGA